MQPKTMSSLAEAVGGAVVIPALLADMIGQPESVFRRLSTDALQAAIDLQPGLDAAETNGEAACEYIGQVRSMLLRLVETIDNHVRCSPVPLTANDNALDA